MCGIVGFHSKTWPVEDVRVYLQILSHRGPDSVGEGALRNCSFAACRLAIVDVLGGDQPIWDETENIAILFNGEIYNYRDLLSNLGARHLFRTKSDTETILHLYQELGYKCFAELNGMFALALLEESKIVLARDRLGEKPLYYYHDRDTFIFASEMKVIAQIIGADPVIDDFLLALETTSPNQTLFRDIYQVPSGSYLVFQDEQVYIEKYWELKDQDATDRRLGSYIEELRWLVTDSIRMRIPEGMDFTCSVSGGLDSAILAAIARPEKVFTSVVKCGPEYDEEVYAELLAKHIGARLIKYVPTTEDFLEHIVDVVWYLDEPATTLAALPQFMIAKKIRETGIKVFMSGIGADELFGGYIRYIIALHWQRLINMPVLEHYGPLVNHAFGEAGQSVEALYYRLVSRRSDISSQERYVWTIFSRERSLVANMGLFDLQVSLPSLLTCEDRAAGHMGLENRSPFLDYRLVEFAFSLPDHLRIREVEGEFVTKYLLREAFRDIIPPAIAQRKDKIGYPSPVAIWLRGELAPLYRQLQTHIDAHAGMRRVIQDAYAPSRGEFDRNRWQVVQLGIWSLLYVENLEKELVKELVSRYSGLNA